MSTLSNKVSLIYVGLFAPYKFFYYKNITLKYFLHKYFFHEASLFLKIILNDNLFVTEKIVSERKLMTNLFFIHCTELCQ